ncbi:MAG: ABC transporter substrate-binding protein [Betaproteobacteria bacterium]|nr:ABC transporter substrate-binding protein [Betaproteobacteria bacterium]
MMRTVSRIVGVLVLVAAWTAHAQTTPPDVLVKNTVNEVLSVIQQNKHRRVLRELAEKKVLPHFDFREMTRLAVGRAWRDASAAQQQALENNFRSLLVATYTTALSQTTGTSQTVEVRPLHLKPGDGDVTVKTLVREPGRQPVAIDYRMKATPAGWKVYDVIVENLSLVTNYRGSFTAEIGRSGIDGLIKTLNEKNQRLAGS